MTVLPEVGRSGFSKNHFEFLGKPIRSISRSQSFADSINCMKEKKYFIEIHMNEQMY